LGILRRTSDAFWHKNNEFLMILIKTEVIIVKKTRRQKEKGKRKAGKLN